MGQGIGRVPEAPAVSDAASGRGAIGRYIAQQRRLRGIDLEDLAARTRIPRRSLERLEAGAFDASPDGFSRGFVRTVAEAIGLDPDDAVARMLPEADASRRRDPRGGRFLGVAAIAIVLAALALGAREIALMLAPRPRPPAGLPVRRDYVRALAEANGIATARLAERDAALTPLPPEPPAPDRVAVESPPAAAAPAPAQTPATAAPKPPAPHAPAPPPAAQAQATAARSTAPQAQAARGEATPAPPSAGPAPPPAHDAEAHD
jgi:cytoskeletal protein RodZ